MEPVFVDSVECDCGWQVRAKMDSVTKTWDMKPGEMAAAVAHHFGRCDANLEVAG